MLQTIYQHKLIALHGYKKSHENVAFFVPPTGKEPNPALPAGGFLVEDLGLIEQLSLFK